MGLIRPSADLEDGRWRNGFDAKMKSLRTLLLLAMFFAFFTYLPSSGNAAQVIHVPTDYLTIQSAVNAATPGDIILIEPGTYNETVSITTSLIIEGENRQTTILNASAGGPALRIQATGVRVSNLTIANFDPGLDGVLVENSSDVTISKIDILVGHASGNGTQILNSQRVELSESRITGANLFGIVLDGGSGHVISKNELVDDFEGIGVFRSSRSIIMGNRLIGPGYDGVQLGYSGGGSYEIVVAYNHVEGFDNSGIHMFDSRENVIQENVLTKIEDPVPGRYAAAIKLQNSTNNAIFLNDLVDNTDLNAQGVFEQDRTGNIWNSYNGFGNYWSNYQGLDEGSADPRTNLPRIAGDGVGDTLLPHGDDQLPGLRFDYYPLMQPWNSTVHAAVASLRVLVLDENGESVSGATITSTVQPPGQASLHAVTNGGSLTFFGIPAGNYTLSASAGGYGTEIRSLMLVAQTLQNETIRLRPEPFSVSRILPYVALGGAVVAAGIVGFLLLKKRRFGLSRKSVTG